MDLLGVFGGSNLNNTETKVGYSLLSTRVRWDDSVVSETFKQEWGDPLLSFRGYNQVIQRIVGGNTVLAKLDWHGKNRAVIFPYPLRGSSRSL